MTDQPTQTVVLVKTEGLFGHLSVGARQHTKHPADQARKDAVARAFSLLKRSCPDENPGCWEVQEAEQLDVELEAGGAPSGV